MVNECKTCGGCCKHVALPLDTPTERDDYENIYWYLLHQNIRVFITEKDEEDREDDKDTENWYIEFLTRCTALGENNLCAIHLNNKKPKICSEYSSESCVSIVGDSEELECFSSAQEFLDYLKKEKGIVLKE